MESSRVTEAQKESQRKVSSDLYSRHDLNITYPHLMDLWNGLNDEKCDLEMEKLITDMARKLNMLKYKKALYISKEHAHQSPAKPHPTSLILTSIPKSFIYIILT
ncbi:hypothetical protein OnM2_048024 [Erysiphe neolycopersici]|uniref:Uncharacterized protein n=1 Tax=Erysiphe neolycopersici TaxID=212602 RepID=A0A420HTH0_9PEZI|nr:hypothetical protein OnM2_048024 [Erysiphe neolycopersici]